MTGYLNEQSIEVRVHDLRLAAHINVRTPGMDQWQTLQVMVSLRLKLAAPRSVQRDDRL